jgi:hypothetical protein
MLRDGRLTHGRRGNQVRHRALGRQEQIEDVPARRLSENVECDRHVPQHASSGI